LPSESGFCSSADDCRRGYYCRESKLGAKPEDSGEDWARDKFDKPSKGKPGIDVRPTKPEIHPGVHPLPERPGQEGAKPPRPSLPERPGQEGANPPKPTRKPAVPYQPTDKMDQEFYRVCAPCYEVECAYGVVASEAHVCCPIIEPQPTGLRKLVVILIVLAVFVCISFVSIVVFFSIRYRRMKREMENLRLYNEHAVQGYQRPNLAPVPEHEYQPGSAVMRVQPTQEVNLVR